MSRKNFVAKPLSYPQPVWIIGTYDENGNPNAMNAAWGGISEENEVSICLSPGHKTCILRGELVNVSVDEAAMTDGKVDVAKVAPICFDPFNHTYNVLGEAVGKAWDAGKALK